MRVVTLEDFTPGKRFDGNPWTAARIEEAAAQGGPFTVLEAQVFGTGSQPAPDADPREPAARDFTTTLAALDEGWYRIVFTDAAANEEPVGPIFVPQAMQAYTSVLAVRRVLAPAGAQDATLGTAAALSDDDIEEAIEEAAGEINSRLAVRYTLPFVSVPPLVEKLNRDIAAYMATLVYRRNKQLGADDPIRLRYTRAEGMLAALATGKMELPLAGEPEGVEAAAADTTAVENIYEGDLFEIEDFSLTPATPARPRWARGRLGPY